MSDNALISQEIQDALNVQVGNELAASIQYTLVSAYFDREALPTLTALFARQGAEEHDHAMRIAHYVTDAGGTLVIPAIPAQQADFASALEAVQLALTQELAVTAQINQLVGMAVDASDYLTRRFLDWFVEEQLEEVAQMSALARTIGRAGDNLLLVEDYLARQGVTPSAGPSEPTA